jgi:cytidine deaminase
VASNFKIEELDETALHNIEALPEGLIEHLLSEARKARDNAYAPYSHYRVGAALLVNSTRLGKRIFTGCNIESETFSPTICAERVAASSAIAAGAEPGSFVVVAIVAGKETPEPGDKSTTASPCGVCRQVLHELSRGQENRVHPSANGMLVVSSSVDGRARKAWTIMELLPDAFSGQI